MIFDGYVHQIPDTDPEHTKEWLDSLDAVVDTQGKTRARFLLTKLLERAQQTQVSFPATVSTPYVNTIPREHEPWFPGDEHIERRIRAFVRWNAAMMVVKANKHADGIGGHLSTFASSASLYEIGFNHFFRGKDDGNAGDAVYFQGHAAPGIYARAFMEGRLTADDLDHFRQEIGRGGRGLSSYPHPRLMPDFWEYPTVSMGLGPLCALYHARYNKYLMNRQIDDTSQTRIWCYIGDGETDEPETLGRHLARAPRAARQPDLRHQLQPAAPRRSGARQRQGDPGARSAVPRRRVERHQGHLGLEVGRAAGPGQGRRAAQPDEHHRRRPVPAVLGGERRVHPRPLLRSRPASASDGRRAHRRRVAQPASRRPRLSQALRRLQGGHREPRLRCTDGHPGQDRQGLDARRGLRGAQRDAPDQEDDEGPARRPPRPACTCTTRSPRTRSTPTTRRTTSRPRTRSSSST